VLALLLRIMAVTALLGGHSEPRCAIAAIVLAPVLGRWSAVLSGATSRYARATDTSPAVWMGARELIVATITVAAIIAAAIGATSDFVRSLAAGAVVALASALWTRACRRRIGGVTGDTLGAGVELSECLVFLVFAAAR